MLFCLPDPDWLTTNRCFYPYQCEPQLQHSTYLLNQTSCHCSLIPLCRALIPLGLMDYLATSWWPVVLPLPMNVNGSSYHIHCIFAIHEVLPLQVSSATVFIVLYHSLLISIVLLLLLPCFCLSLLTSQTLLHV